MCAQEKWHCLAARMHCCTWFHDMLSDDRSMHAGSSCTCPANIALVQTYPHNGRPLHAIASSGTQGISKGPPAYSFCHAFAPSAYSFTPCMHAFVSYQRQSLHAFATFPYPGPIFVAVLRVSLGGKVSCVLPQWGSGVLWGVWGAPGR